MPGNGQSDHAPARTNFRDWPVHGTLLKTCAHGHSMSYEVSTTRGGLEEGWMPTIEGKEGRLWIDAYVKKAGKLAGLAGAVRTLVKKTAASCEEYVSPWKVPSFDSNGPLCCFVLGEEHVTLAFLRGAALPDPEKLLEGKARFVRNIRLRSLADVKRPGVKKLIAEATKLNRKDPPSGMMVGMEKRKAKTIKR